MIWPDIKAKLLAEILFFFFLKEKTRYFLNWTPRMRSRVSEALGSPTPFLSISRIRFFTSQRGLQMIKAHEVWSWQNWVWILALWLALWSWACCLTSSGLGIFSFYVRTLITQCLRMQCETTKIICLISYDYFTW